MNVITRERFLQRIKDQYHVHDICGLIGPRQCGKTTLARYFTKNYPMVHWFDGENPDDVASLENPLRTLEHLTGWVVIDEIQRLPALFPVLRVLVDRRQAQYLILGSVSPSLIQQSSESLAGRIGYVELTPFHYGEQDNFPRLLTRFDTRRISSIL